ncbi:pyridoxal phosphate-dependent transferase [Xylariaceae sp. FL0804]|nr:pyridoxal phosphate-dependent transferase [Xylariaceae sp. FL0804]
MSPSMSPTVVPDELSTAAEDVVKTKMGVCGGTTKKAAPPDAAVQAALTAAGQRFEDANPKSKRQHELAAESLPGGNTRSVLHTPPFPLTMKCGKGPYLWDEDGHKYTDLVGEMTAGLYGHSHPAIRAAVVSTLDDVGLSLGATTAQEQRHAALVRARFGLARVRFAGTGTEANLHAVAAARRHTGRRRVLVFAGAYHGALLSFSVPVFSASAEEGGSGSGRGIRGGAARVPPNTVDRDEWVVGTYNDAASARSLIQGAASTLAAVLVEPMQGAAGCLPATREFLAAVRDAAHEAGALLVFDEVMTSRLHPGGLQRKLGVKPDLTTLGKYLGGGLPCGALGGRADVMAAFDPRAPGALSHSGTFNNNTLSMSAGYAGLADVYTDDVCVALNAQGDALRARLQRAAAGTRLTVTGVGALLGLHFTDSGVKEVRCVQDLDARADLQDLFWFDMLEQGYWVACRGMVALVLDTPQEELDRFVDCVETFLQKHREFVALT